MYAIVEIAGQQFKIEKGRTVYTHRLQGDADAALASDQVKVLLVDNDGSISVGAPTVDGATVTAKIVEHLKGEKVIVFKKKRRKGYKKKNGHRQYLTKVLIEDITV
ncbi:50S ribosomal protein L21 [Fibrisoma montanum]|uniref:Large ribosomal subunit protein bL21 n=1 Tax=Fibrisoma montanum TaxID=2305895 RepID=A0A418MES0_9BACT|nr:50S ribosomal protein L21 [Fibrisoma montanum]RIV25298.1 50S ribosomal protein L21 [Fibrisoma montanum]